MIESVKFRLSPICTVHIQLGDITQWCASGSSADAIIAKENNIQYIAFPAISCGIYRYPHDKAAKISISTVKEFAKDFREIHFVLWESEIFNLWVKKAKKLL